MKKFFIQKAFVLTTLFFVFLALFSFAAFRETGQVCAQAQSCIRELKPAQHSEMLWEVVSRQFLTLLSI